MKIINLTPHTIVLYSTIGQGTSPILEYPSEGTIRLETKKRLVTIKGLSEEVPTVAVVRTRASPDNLPPEVDGTWYCVSAMVQEAHPERMDFIAPNTSSDTSGAVRDDKGNIIGVRSFIVNSNHE